MRNPKRQKHGLGLGSTGYLMAGVALFAMVAAGASSAQHTAEVQPAEKAEKPQPFLGAPAEAALAEALEHQIVGENAFGGEATSLSDANRLALRAAYAQSLFKPLWTRAGADRLDKVKGELFDHGLMRDDRVDPDFDALVERRFSSDNVAQRASADIELSIGWLNILSAISGGLSDEGEADSTDNTTSPAQSLLVQHLQRMAAGEEVDLSAFEPTHPQYQRLKSALAEYREMAADGGWGFTRNGALIRLEERDPRVLALRERLIAERYLPINHLDGYAETPQTEGGSETGEDPLPDPMVMDDRLESALKWFQRSHGLEDDGVLGPNTVQALNESPASKIDRIADTMHRWRSLGALKGRYIWANVPSFRAEAWNGGNQELRVKTIVGLPSRETPEFSDKIDYLVADPKWYAPISIVARDKLPKLQKDASYARQRNFRVYDRASGEEVSPAEVNWQSADAARKYRLVQQPGENNALGQLKIIFPNQYSVYLHGTPGKHLFKRAQRTFSSGCIRLEDPVAMARWIAGADGSAKVERLRSELDDDRLDTSRIDMDTEIPIHITYMTVTVEDDGTIRFWRDVYERDDGIEYVEKAILADTQSATRPG
jgi:murein L,D-transpeptidase YcbB/YkuD